MVEFSLFVCFSSFILLNFVTEISLGLQTVTFVLGQPFVFTVDRNWPASQRSELKSCDSLRGRTVLPSVASGLPGEVNSTSRRQTHPSNKTQRRNRPVIPRVTIILRQPLLHLNTGWVTSPTAVSGKGCFLHRLLLICICELQAPFTVLLPQQNYQTSTL